MTHPTPERLGAYLDGELDAPERAAMDAHLAGCAECGALLADLSAVDDAARGVPLTVPADYFEDFAPRVRARLEKRTRGWRPPVWSWAAAAALLLAVVTPLALRDAGPPVREPTGESRLGKQPAPSAGSPGRGDFARDAPVPPATVLQPAPSAKRAAPGAEPLLGKMKAAEPEAAAEGHDARANTSADSRISRRDRAAQEPTSGAGAPPAAVLSPQAVPMGEEQAKRELDGLVLQDRAESTKEDERSRAPGSLAPRPAPAPATGQRPYGQRSQNTVPSAPSPARKAATESKSADAAKDKQQGADAPAEDSEVGAAGSMQESVTVTRDSLELAAGRESMKFRSLARSKPPRSDAEARALRESWRVFASEHPDHPEADEARVRMVEAGVLAYRLGGRSQDRDVALRDGRDYLERPVAPQAARVRAVLRALSPAGQ